MKRILLLLVLSVMTVFVFGIKPHIDNVRVDEKRSTIKWIGSKVASSHEGNVNIAKGSLLIDHGILVGGQIAIDMNSISCSDIESEKKNKYLVDHLKDDDFFDVSSFPLAIIAIEKAVKVSGNSYDIVANLTIKGITNPINFQAEVDIKGARYKATARIEIDRTKWDINYNSGSFFKDLGDKLILDEIIFDVELSSLQPSMSGK